MKNGCPECEKLPDGEMCDICEFDWLLAQVEQAVNAYKEKAEQIIAKLKAEKITIDFQNMLKGKKDA